MPDMRRHRGPHPRDIRLFAREFHGTMNRAVAHLSWLLTRGYAPVSSLKLVGDRFALLERQRLAVMRCSCSDEQLDDRSAKRTLRQGWRGQRLEIDGFNVLTTVEAALSGGILLLGRDGCVRDMASMHGSYRKVDETRPAIDFIGQVLAEAGVPQVVWRLDRPVSNSGRLKQMLLGCAAERKWDWTVEIDADPDARLAESENLVATADSLILDRCRRWCRLAGDVVEEHVPEASIVALSGTDDG